MKTLLVPMASCAVLAASLMAASPAQAADEKYYNGASCVPYSNLTTPADLSVRAHGLKNISSEAEYVVCSLIADVNPELWSTSSPGNLRVLFNGVAATSTRCEFYIGSNLSGLPVTYLQQAVIGIGDGYGPQFSNLSSEGGVFPYGSQISVFCRIPPGASIFQLRLTETAASAG